MLTPKEPWELHTYFEFTKRLSDEELIAQRKSITDRLMLSALAAHLPSSYSSPIG